MEMRFDVGIGSGACRLASDPEGIIYTVTDRGPNIKTKDALKLMGVDFAGKKGKIFPTPNFSPTIYKLEVRDGRVTVLDKIQIKTADGRPISGISNPDTEPAWDVNGKEMSYDPDGIDAEGIVKLKDGTFWIGEEYGPSILHVGMDGRVIERWVPEGVGESLADAGYEVKELLPAILRKRALNRGIESMAASPDEKYLYFAMQSPLANPDKDTYKKSRQV
ncbi:MAG: esterase-like activity of phytase family protein, partial [Thermodesulfobacteriota bacterium]|nr:esterase-like activity of phytase family protein [Thermodesulfobacteriota bacterium]